MFMAIADPQINIPKWGVEGTEEMIDIMNELPGEPFPFGGTVARPKGVLIAGDLVDALDNPENWKRYKTLFDPRGEARLRFPTYEGAGNHDLSGKVTGGDFTYVEKALIERNRRRPTKLNLGPRGYHYSWDWGHVHFVCVNVFPGQQPRPVYDRPAPWNHPKSSLSFLQKDLAEHVGDSGRPIILMWHYGLRGWGLDKWWTEEDLENLARAIERYNVALILHGHEHRYERYQWRGYDVMMAPSPQFDRDPDDADSRSRPKGVLVFRVQNDSLQAGYRTPQGWEDTWEKTTSATPRETADSK